MSDVVEVRIFFGGGVLDLERGIVLLFIYTVKQFGKDKTGTHKYSELNDFSCW